MAANPQAPGGGSKAPTAPAVNLDLTSRSANIQAGSSVGGGVIIHEQTGTGSVINKTVTSTSVLTPAEYLAAIQMATAGTQQITIGASHNAIAGTFNLNIVPVTGINIPQGVVGVNNFASASTLNLSGSLINAGTFYAVSDSRRVTTATIIANNIVNTGTITSIIPPGGIAGYSGLVTNLNLALSAATTIVNNGTISSAGSLSLQAGTSVTNQAVTPPPGGTISPAVLAAQSSLTVNAPTINNLIGGQITAQNDINIITNVLNNSNLLNSIAGNLVIQNPNGTKSLAVNNTGGVLSGGTGLNISSFDNGITNVVTVTGGTLTGPSIGLNAGNGQLSVNVDDVSPNVTVNGATAKFAVGSGSSGLNFQLGNLTQFIDLSYTGAGQVNLPGMNTGGASLIVNTTAGITAAGAINTTTSGTQGNAGNVSLTAGGGDVNVQDITTTGLINGSGGNVSLIASGNVNAGNINSSGGSVSGAAGSIYIQAGYGGNSGTATTGSLTASSGQTGGSISVLAPGAVNVNGNITTPGGTLTLGGSTSNVSGNVNVGSSGQVNLTPDGDQGKQYVVDLAAIVQKYGGDNLVIGSLNGSFKSDIVLNSDCNGCLGRLNSIVFATTGHYSATGTTTSLSSATDFTVDANSGINTGSVVGGHSVTFNTQGVLTVDGNVLSNGGVNLASTGSGGGVSISSGRAVSGSAVSINTTSGDVLSGGAITSTSGNVSVLSGGSVNLLDSSSINAAANLAIKAQNAVTIGSSGGQGVALQSAGGSVIIDNYMNGTGQSGITLGDNVSMSAKSTSSAPGDIGLTSGSDVLLGSGAVLNADGGNIWLSATNNINTGSGTQFTSTAEATPGGGYSGGQIGVLAGAPQTNMASLLNGMSASRTSANQISVPEGSTFTQDNTINATNGSMLSVVFPANSTKTVTGNTFNLNGGVLYLDPPSASNNVTITGTTFNITGQPITGTSGGTTAGTTGTTSGTTGGTTSGTTAGTTSGTTAGTTGGTSAGSTTGTTGGTTLGLLGGTTGLTIVGTTGGSSGTDGGSSVGSTAGSLSSAFGSSASLNLATGLTGALTSNGPGNSANSSTALQTDNINGGISLTTPGSATVLQTDSTHNETQSHNGLSAAIYCTQAGTLKPNGTVDDDNSWIMASNKCQPFSFENADGSIIIGSGPAIFTPSINRTLLLKEGKLLVVAGEGIIIVRTPVCNLTVPINSAATVEYKPDGKLGGIARLTNLAGGKASVSITRQDETMILSASPGEQLVFVENSPQTEIRCEPSVANKKIQSWLVQIAGFRAEKFSFDRQEMLAREDLLNCTLGCFTKLQQGMIEQIRKSMNDLTPPTQLKSLLPARSKSLIAANIAGADHMKAVGFGGQMLDLTAPAITTLACQSALVKYTSAASVSLDSPSQINLKHGDTIVSASRPTTVIAGRYSVKMEANTIALISNRGDHVIVRSIYESKLASIKIATPEKRCLGVLLGQETIVGREGISYTRVLGEDAIGRRRMRHLALGTNATVITSEISLVSLLHNTDILSQISRSPMAEDKVILNKVLKMAVALSMITQGHGNYSMVGQ